MIFDFSLFLCVCVCRMAAAVEERSSGTIRALVPKLRERLRGWGGCVVWINRLITNRRQKDRRQQQSLHLAVKTVQPLPRGVLTVTSQWSRIKKSKTWRTKQKTETIDLTTFLTFLGVCVFLFVYLFFIIIFTGTTVWCVTDALGVAASVAKCWPNCWRRKFATVVTCASFKTNYTSPY